MARIVGVDLPKNKRGEIGLTYIYGIGRSTARKILETAGISYDLKVQDWSDDQVGAIRSTIADTGHQGRGRMPLDGPAEHQAPDGYRLLPRHPSPSGSSGPRSVNQEQCAHPQGPQEDRRKQEKGNEVIFRELWQRKLEQLRKRLSRSVLVGNGLCALHFQQRNHHHHQRGG